MKPIRKFLAVLLTFSFFLSSPSAFAAELLDRVAAVVNDEIITQSELDQFLGPIYNEYRKNLSGDDLVVKMNLARQNLLSQMIEDKLVYQEAKKMNVPVSEEEVNARLEEFKARFKDESEFKKAMTGQGLSLTKVRERYKEQIAIRKLHQFEVQSKVIVTPGEIEAFYQKNQRKFTQDEVYHVRTITVRKSEEASAAGEADNVAKEKASEILRRLYEGQKFEDMAKQYSEDTKAESGGDLGWVKRGDLLASLEDVIFNLKIGDISPVLESPMGYHLFKVEEKQEKQVKALQEVRDQIKDYLFRKKSQRRFKSWMKRLKKDAYITIR